jgi:ligand-binding sensor domain-containing protein/signal transduction histidine kinase
MSVCAQRLRIPRASLLLFAFLALASPTLAERLIVKSYTTADGLPNDTVKCVVEDALGFLWFCTDDGLSRFDGYRFTNYGVDDGLPSAFVNGVLPTPDGRYWIATGAGLVRFDPRGTPASGRAMPDRSAGDRRGNSNTVPPPAMFSTFVSGLEGRARHITSLLRDRAGRIWVGTLDGLYRMTAAEGQPVNLANVDLVLPNQLDHQEISCLMEDRRGMLWIGTMRGLYRRRADGTVQTIVLSPHGENWTVHALLEDRDGRVWVGTRNQGLYHLTVDPVSDRPIVRSVYTAPRDMPTNWITTIVQSADGAVWVGSNAGVIHFLPDSGADVYRIRTYWVSERPDEVWSIAEDRQHNLWLGRSHAGVAKLWNRGLTKFDASDGLSWANSINVTRTGELIAMGGRETGRWCLCRFDGTKFVGKPPVQGVAPGWGWSQTLLQDRMGDWWVGTVNGLFRFTNLKTIDDVAWSSPSAIYTPREGLASIQVLRLFEDTGGDVWIGTVGGPGTFGLSRWQRKSGTFRHYTDADGLPRLDQFYVASFAEDRAGHVWIGFSGGGGLARHQNGRFERFAPTDGVPPGRIANLLLDSKGRLWVATDRAGVFRIDAPGAEQPTFVAYTTAQGLSSNAAGAVVEDTWGRIYVGTGRGIDRIDPASGRIQHYTSADGVPTGALAAVRDGHGALWFTAVGGVVRVVPQLDPPQHPPPILITALNVAGLPQSISAVGEPEVRLIEPSSRNTNLQIDFVALGFSYGEELLYQYMLEGADDAWSKPSTQRTVNYASLAPGSYRFLVRAVNSDAMVSATPATVSFTVLPPIWWRWWFITLAALSLAAATYRLHRARVTRLMGVVQMRTGIASDLHDDIGANLTRIAILSEVARRQQPWRDADRPVDQSLASIARIARESVAGMSDIVWAISPEHDNLGDLVRKMREHVEEVFAVRNLGVVFNPPGGGLLLKLDSAVRRDCYLIFKEAVNNAARHSGCSKIAVDFRVDHSHLYLAVTDDGTGFDVTTDSDGHGLISMRQRAKRLGTTLDVDSRVGHGTTIRLTIAIMGGPLTGRRSTGTRRSGRDLP